MIEIKFRVWFHEKDNIKNGEWIDIQYSTGEKESVISLGVNIFEENENLKYCQYTGLKDKNGKEIYEGDILNYGTPKYIYFDEKEERYLLKNDNIGYEFYVSDLVNQSKIIGNIY